MGACWSLASTASISYRRSCAAARVTMTRRHGSWHRFRKSSMKSSLRDRTAVVGVGNTPFGALYRNLDPERSPYNLGAEAFVEALADSGLKKSDIDGVLVCRVPDYGRMCEV